MILNSTQRQVFGKMIAQALGFISGCGVAVLVAYGLYKAYQGFIWLVQKLSMKYWGFALEADAIVVIGLFAVIVLGLIGGGIYYWYVSIRAEVDRANRQREHEEMWRHMNEPLEPKPLVDVSRPKVVKPVKKSPANRLAWMLKIKK